MIKIGNREPFQARKRGKAVEMKGERERERRTDDLLLQAFLKEIQAVVDLLGQVAEIQPDVERRVGHILDLEAHVLEAAQHVVALRFEVCLQRFHFLEDVARLEHGDGSFLEGNVGAAVQVRATAANGFDELLGTDDPGDSPARETETLRQAVYQEDVILVDVDDVVGGGDASAVAIAGVIVAGVEFIHDQGGTVTANVLDFRELRVLYNLPGRVSRVAGEDDRGASGDFVSDLVGVDVVAVIFGERRRDGGEILEEGQHSV